MGYQSNFIAHLPATLLYMTSTVFLALAALNTPLIKSLFFLKATYTMGSNAGQVRFGTLGFCFDRGAGESCTGPKIGYQIDLNSIFDLDTGSLISIPDAVGKYLTYVLILHVVALISSVITILFRLLDTVDNVSLLCFPSLASWFTSAVTFAAFIIDLVIFYIAKARIDSVDGASAEIGSCVWFTLVAWVLPVIAGCCCSINAVESRRKPRDKRRRGDEDDEYPQSAGGYAKVPGPPLNKYGEREVSVPLDSSGMEDGKKSEDLGGGYYPRGQQGDPHYQPRTATMSRTGQAPGTSYPPQHQDPYSTGYYEDYDTHRETGDLGVGAGTTAGTYAGVGAGAAVVGAGAAGYGTHRSASGQAGYTQQGYEGYPPVQQGYEGQYGHGQAGYSHHSHDDGYGSNNHNNTSYVQPMPMPVPQALSPDHTANRIDPYANPSYMNDPATSYPSQSNSNYPPPAQDAYGGYETPNTARPVENHYGYASGYGHQDGMVAAPMPRTMNSHLPDGTPNFPLSDSVTSPIGSGQNHANMYDTTAHEGMNAPPSYAVAADQPGTQAPRRNPSMDKSGGYFR